MANSSILRIVPTDYDDCNAAVLRSAIARRFRESFHTDDDNNKIRISNRYFDADVLLLGPDESADGVALDGAVISHNQFNQEDGMILVFDATSSSSFDSLGISHTSAELNGRCGELLRLCVATAFGHSQLSDGSKQSEDEYSRRVLWCLDRGYEYVEVDLTPEGLARGHDERDKDGFARVVEAIATCMWSSHVMKRRGANGGNAGGPDSGKDTVLKVSAVHVNAASQSNHAESGKESATASPPTDDAEREKAAMVSLMERVKEDRPEMDLASRDEIAENQQDEMAFHQLEAVLSDAKLIREASRNNSMSDEERRDRAGDTATKLMALLDSLGLPEEEDTEEGSVSDGE